jgi:hypothetical protein
MDYSALARSYNTLSYTPQLRGLLAAFFQTDKFNNMTKYELAKTVNDTLFNNYEGEQILKYKLAKDFRNKNYVAAFEVRAKNSRTDFLVINGDTKSFEVKSKIDTLNRLSKQVDDYGDVFEYNTVVIDKSHLNNVLDKLPDFYGIWYFEGSKKVIYREAKYSPKINAIEQLGLMNKKELNKAFGNSNKAEILKTFDHIKINDALKVTLKQRYYDRWAFVQSNWDKILPIDVQFFFNTNVKPEIIYGA